jgi:dihydrofolate reductase
VGAVFAEISMSVDGFVAGPNPSLEDPLGEGGEQLHEWAVELETFQERHGREGGVRNQDSDLLKEAFDRTGATVMGRKMFSGGTGPWESDRRADGWWGDNPPFRVPVFVLTHHPRETLEMEGGTSFIFVTDGLGAALARAREAAGDMDVAIGGGASAIQQALAAGFLDEIQVHVAPVLLGGGTRLFGDGEPARLEQTRVIQSPAVTHVKYRVLRG